MNFGGLVKQIWNIFKEEYRMSIRRPGMWLAYGVIFLLYFYTMTLPERAELPKVYDTATLWAISGVAVFELNLFSPLLAGISTADRMVRDRTLKMDELLRSTPLTRWSYVLGKYTAALISMLTPLFLYVQVISIFLIIKGAPIQIVWMNLVSFCALTLPAYAFVTAFSVACPLVVPLRVYQVLFTGYWFWGNYLNPGFIPTLAGTWLMPCGKIVLESLFRTTVMIDRLLRYTPFDALMNLIVLAACIVIILTAAERWLAWKARTA